MGSPITVPKLGWTMEEGVLIDWLVADGAEVAAGDPLYLLDNDKVENEIAASASGVVRQTGVAGETYPVGAQIGTIE
ncbi:lipoyl domain-containing protein [Lentzea sp. NPDC051838]|uniref:lipoyl domain-containing protein n=1 Tax=Lentzea sp. NPDC051838 TaxID=3154849 RepID=UPI003431BA67